MDTNLDLLFLFEFKRREYNTLSETFRNTSVCMLSLRHTIVTSFSFDLSGAVGLMEFFAFLALGWSEFV